MSLLFCLSAIAITISILEGTFGFVLVLWGADKVAHYSAGGYAFSLMLLTAALAIVLAAGGVFLGALLN
jgi:hypothetical protein